MNNLYRRDGWVKSPLGPAIPGAQIWVCSQPANTDFLPPIPLISVFSDPAGLVPVTQPIITDGFGHYDYYVAPGLYTEIVAFGGKVQKVYPDQSIGNVGTAGTSSLLLSTNGTPNFNQALQNLVQGAGVTIVTDNFGNTTITGSAITPPTMTNTVGGLVPTPPNDATKFLNGAGVFSVPSSGGGLLTATITILAANVAAGTAWNLIVPAPGPNKVIMPVGNTVFRYRHGTVGMSTAVHLQAETGIGVYPWGASGQTSSNFSSTTEDKFDANGNDCSNDGGVVPFSSIANVPLYIYASQLTPNQGNGSITATVSYVVIDLT